MISRLLAPTLAVAMSLTAPAASASDQVAQAVAGLAAMLLVGDVMQPRVADDGIIRTQGYAPRLNDAGREHDRPGKQVGGANGRHVAPAACRTEAALRGHWRDVYDRNCLEHSARRAGMLTDDCLRKGWTRHGWRQVYDARCLAADGWVLAGRP